MHTNPHRNATNHVQTDFLRPLLRHKWGQSYTHSTTNERGSPKITPLLEPGATSDFMSTAARLIYSRSALSTPTAAQKAHLCSPSQRHVEHLHHPTSYIPNTFTDLAPELSGEYVALSVTDKGGQAEPKTP